MKQHITGSLLLLVATGSCLVHSQFLQPQSHLGRLVQSITSPLVLGGGAAEPESYGSPYHLSGSPSSEDESSSGESVGPRARPQANSYASSERQRQHYQQSVGLQQAPSQQRGYPQPDYHYRPASYNQDGGSNHNNDDVGSAPTNNKGTQEYQMGAYLGPSVDDKEINGVFNGRDDERDSDDGPPSGYSNEQPGGSGGQQGDVSGYEGPAGYPSGGQQGRAYNSNGNNYHHQQELRSRPSYDEDSTDEDEGGASEASGRAGSGRLTNRFQAGPLNQAASHYSQQRGTGPSSAGSMVAAANGYAPYGYNGPIDLTGMMGAGGDPNAAGFQLYNGDGSYPGQNYYNQQGGGRAGRGRYDQSASMGRGRYNNQNNRDNDDDGLDSDED